MYSLLKEYITTPRGCNLFSGPTGGFSQLHQNASYLRVEVPCLGVKLGYTQQRGDYSSLEPADPAFGDMQYGTLLYGLSAALVRPDRYYVGFAMSRAIFGSKDSDYVRQFGRDNTFYVSAAAIFDLDESIYLIPNLLNSYR